MSASIIQKLTEQTGLGHQTRAQINYYLLRLPDNTTLRAVLRKETDGLYAEIRHCDRQDQLIKLYSVLPELFTTLDWQCAWGYVQETPNGGWRLHGNGNARNLPDELPPSLWDAIHTGFPELFNSLTDGGLS